MDFSKTVGDVHPSLHGTSLGQSTNISDNTLEGLEQTILKLKTERKVRFQKVTCVFSLMSLLNIVIIVIPILKHLSRNKGKLISVLNCS